MFFSIIAQFCCVGIWTSVIELISNRCNYIVLNILQCDECDFAFSQEKHFTALL